MEEISVMPGVEEEAIAAPTSVADLQPKMKLTGTVKRLELYGAFVDLGLEASGLIHISKLGTGQVNRVSDVLTEGQQIEVWVDKVDAERNQVMLTMIEPVAVDWQELKEGQIFTGKVTRLEGYGAFVDIGAEREGLVHISEISHDYLKNPSEALSVNQEVPVQVLAVNKRKRRIDLSIKRLQEKPQVKSSQASSPTVIAAPEPELIEEPEETMTAMELALRKAMGDDSIDAISQRKQRRARQAGGRRSKKRGRDQRQDQEDVFSRTLQLQDN
jgi:ribosomal protein S1